MREFEGERKHSRDRVRDGRTLIDGRNWVDTLADTELAAAAADNAVGDDERQEEEAPTKVVHPTSVVMGVRRDEKASILGGCHLQQCRFGAVIVEELIWKWVDWGDGPSQHAHQVEKMPWSQRLQRLTA